MNSITGNIGQLQAPSFKHIPLALQQGQQFVIWKREKRRDGKVGKTPYIARAALQNKEFRASSTKPQNWSTFSQAHAAYERGGWDGIGRVLTGGLIFIDVDHCIDQDTDTTSEAALEIITLVNSFNERSPSDGIHIFAEGDLPADLPNIFYYQDHKIEVYTSGRYATLTGQPVPGAPILDIQPRQAEILAFLQRCSTATSENTSGVCCASSRNAQQSQASTSRVISSPPVRSGGAGALRNSKPSRSSLRLAIRDEDLPQDDQAILAAARSAANGQVFRTLWEGGDPKARNDESQADFDLTLMLLYWAGDDAARVERLFRASPRYLQRQVKMERVTAKKQYTYLQLTIYNALRKRQRVTWRVPQPKAQADAPAAKQPTPTHQARRIKHAHRWARKSETPEERQQKLEACAKQIAEQVERHIREGGAGLLIASVAPGVGKSTTVAPLGERTMLHPDGQLNLAWIAERRDMVNQVEALRHYRLIEPCTRHNCPDHHLHSMLGERGYNSWSVHKKHPAPCAYSQQFQDTGSAVYQLAHVATRYPAGHEGIVIDELDIAKWLPERELSIDKLVAATRQFATGSTADLFLRCATATITDAAQAHTPLHGQDLFAALNQRSGGQLANWIGELAQDGRYTNTHPWAELDEEDPAAIDYQAYSLAPVALPHLLKALMAELAKWQRGEPWNSCLRIGPGAHGWALYITERLDFIAGEDGQLPTRAILDATADAEILSLRFHERIELVKGEIEPPPGTRHIAVRSGKRYGKTSLCARRKNGSRPDLQRVIAECRYILRDVDPEGEALAAHQVGLISFMGCIEDLGNALGIPPERRLHFWAARGSNALEDCTILLVVGTPTIHPDTVARLARALWADDPQPIATETEVSELGIRRYADPRMQRLNDYLTRAELTQCAHRSRALRYPNRTVVTLCLGDIDYLPATETITELPQLTAEGWERWGVSRELERKRLDQAREQLALEGKNLAALTVRELKAAAGVGTDAAADYLRELRSAGQQETHQAHTHTQLVSTDVPQTPIKSITSNAGYSPGPQMEPPRPAPPVDIGAAILAYAEAHAYPALAVGDVRIEADQRAWQRFVWLPGPTREQRRQVYNYVLTATG